MDLKDFYISIPPLTRYYLTAVITSAFLITYVNFPIIQYLYLDYTLAFKKFQLWRLITNVVVIGRFSMNFLFFLFFSYSTLSRTEKSFLDKRRYAEFIMMIIYLILFLHLVKVIGFLIFNLPSGFTVAQELIFSLIYIDSKRDPERPASIYGIQIKSK